MDKDKREIADAYDVILAQRPWRHGLSEISHHRILPWATLAPWLDDAEFLNIYEKIVNHTLVDLYRCYELWTLAKQSSKVEGDILEVGVWRGGTGAILAQAAKSADKKVYLADTFKGVVKAGENDTLYTGGEHSDTSVTRVVKLMLSNQISNVKLLEGIFPADTAHTIDGNIAMLHCDVDVYSSAKDIVDWCYPRLSIGAVLVFDDYGFFGCEGITKYCDELKEKRDLVFIHNLNGHAIFVKIS